MMTEEVTKIIERLRNPTDYFVVACSIASCLATCDEAPCHKTNTCRFARDDIDILEMRAALRAAADLLVAENF